MIDILKSFRVDSQPYVNLKNQLIAFEQDGVTTEYAYNVDGIRTSKISAHEETHYTVDSNQQHPQVIQEYSNVNGVVTYTYGDDLISQKRQEETFDYHYDGLGSVRYLSDESGSITDTYDYEAFGKLISRIGDTNNTYLYTGEQYDEETHNYYLRARYYNELIGRFTQRDSYAGNMQDPLTLHKYLYANANPVMYIDPTGYYSMMDMSMAMSMRNMLSNVQTESYSMFADALMRKDDDIFSDLPVIAAAGIGNSLLMRFSQKFRDLCKNSFDVTTLVSTENGLIPISQIQIGDKVWSYSENNQTTSLQEVTHLRRSTGNKELVDIALQNGEIITATANHPLWSVDLQKWVEAGELTKESILFNLQDQNVSIEKLKHYSQEQAVYNLTIANDHTYFVGQSGVLGHNADDHCPLFRSYYRGGDKLEGRDIDIPTNQEGYIKPGKGLSINLNPNDPFVVRYGGAYEIFLPSIPSGLGIFQRGKPNHYQIEPLYPMKPNEFNDWLKYIRIRKAH